MIENEINTTKNNNSITIKPIQPPMNQQHIKQNNTKQAQTKIVTFNDTL